MQADLQRNQNKHPKLQLNSLLSLAREIEREETKDRRKPTLFPGLQNSTHSAYSFHATVTMNQDKMPLKVQTTKKCNEQMGQKNRENYSALFLVSGCYSTIKDRKTERKTAGTRKRGTDVAVSSTA
jgi:hypothetical protein